MKHKITPDAVIQGRSLRQRVTAAILALKPDEAYPVADIRAEFGISARHLSDILRELKASMQLNINGKVTVCAVHPKTAEKYNAE